MKPPREVLGSLESVRLETLQKLEPLTQAQLDWSPPDGGWSLGEIFMHLALDEHYLRENIARPLLEGIRPPDGVTFLPPPPPPRTDKAVIEFWFARARATTRHMIETWPCDGNVTLTHEGGLEPMNSLEWLEGYAGHEAFHHRQLDRVMELVREHSIR